MTEPAAVGAGGVLVTWRAAPVPVKALLLGVLVNRLAGFLQIFLVLFLVHRGFSAGQAGFALGGYAVGAVFGTFLGGSLSDRLSPRDATLLSMVGSAVLIISVLYVHVYALLLLAVFLISAVGQFYRPAAQALITELTPRNRLVLVTAMYRLSLNLGTTATPLVGAALVSISYSLLFWGEALAAAVYAVIALVAMPGDARTPVPADGERPRPVTRGSGGYLAVLADWRYTLFLVAVLLTSTVYSQYTSTLPLAIQRAGLSVWWYSAVVSLNALVVVACELLMTRLVQTWPLRITVLAGFGLVAIGFGVYAIGMLPAVLIVGTLIWTLSEIVGAPTVFAYPGMAGPERLRGRYIGALQTAFGLGAAIGPVAGLAVLYHVGSMVWILAAVVAVVATALGQVGIDTAAARRQPTVEPEPSIELSETSEPRR